MRAAHAAATFLIVLTGTGRVCAQQVISAKAGLIQYFEGDVTVDGEVPRTVDSLRAFSRAQGIRKEGLVRTRLGRVELLLASGVFLRLGENSLFRMASNSLDDTRIDLLSGEAVLEVRRLEEENRITIRAGDSAVTPRKRGLYRIEAAPAELRVYDGEAVVVTGDRDTLARKRERVVLAEGAEAGAFDVEAGDALVRWSARRAAYLGMLDMKQRDLNLKLTWNEGWLRSEYFGLETFLRLQSGGGGGGGGFANGRGRARLPMPGGGGGRGGGGGPRGGGGGGGRSGGPDAGDRGRESSPPPGPRTQSDSGNPE